MPHPRPTDGELAILCVLWDRGPSTVKELHRVLSEGKDTAYTTVLRMCQIMVDKGLLTRDEVPRQHIYTAAIGRETTQQGLVGDLLEKAFRGSATSLVMQALGTHPPQEAELEQIQLLLDQLRRERS